MQANNVHVAHPRYMQLKVLDRENGGVTRWRRVGKSLFLQTGNRMVLFSYRVGGVSVTWSAWCDHRRAHI